MSNSNPHLIRDRSPLPSEVHTHVAQHGGFHSLHLRARAVRTPQREAPAPAPLL